MPCDRRVPGAAAPTAAGGRRRKVMQARNREFRRLNAEREADDQFSKWARQFKSCLHQSKREIQEKSCIFFYATLRPTGSRAAAPTAAGGRRRKVMQARNREFRRLNAERESGRPDFEVGKAGSNPVSAIEKRDTRKILYLFLCPATEKRCFTRLGRCAKNKAR